MPNRGQICKIKHISHSQEQVVVTWCQVRTVEWIYSKFPSKFLARHQRYVRTGVILMKHDSSPIHQY
uniref:Uncharacterized protein n=1 Tax=Lepeophtheirus salmonis TaxID=72036 RepID=A0A0K2U8E1_LEPSM